MIRNFQLDQIEYHEFIDYLMIDYEGEPPVDLGGIAGKVYVFYLLVFGHQSIAQRLQT